MKITTPLNKLLKYFIIHLTLFLLLISQFSCEESLSKKFDVTLDFSDLIELENVHISYDNGKEVIYLENDQIKSQINISDTFYSQYAAIIIQYPDTSSFIPFEARFFISDKQANIKFKRSLNHNPLDNYIIKSGLDFKKNGGEKLDSFIYYEQKDFEEFYMENVEKFGSNDSLVKILFNKSDLVLDKKAEFVLNNNDLYFSFWLFRNEVAYNPNISSDSLITMYSSIFHEELKESEEGREIMKVINGKNIKKDQKAIDFEALDIDGEKIGMNIFAGKFVLINFWASWCAPCIAEMPVIVDARNDYSTSDLEFIFVTLDKDTTAFIDAVEKYNIDFGHHLFANNNLIKLFGAQSIPKVYLVDPNGIVLYSRAEEQDVDLQILSKILESSL